MKKLFALLTALILILSMTAALADGDVQSKEVKATYEKAASYASDEVVYAMNFTWGGALSTNLVFKGDEYVWDTNELKYVLHESGGFDADNTQPAAYSVSFTNRGNRGYTCKLSFTPANGISADFASDAEKSVNIDSAAPAFDLSKLDEASAPKTASLSGGIKITGVDLGTITLNGAAADGSIAANAANDVGVGTLMLTIEAISGNN